MNRHDIIKKNMKIIASTKGFTLVELLLYVSVAAVILLAVVQLMSLLLESRIKNQAIAEVEQQGTQLLQLITQRIRNARVITAPAIGATTLVLSLTTDNVSTNPTVFDMVNGRMRISEAGNLLEISSPWLEVSDISFSNATQAGTPGTVRVEFTISHANPDGRGEFEYERHFIGSASIR